MEHRGAGKGLSLGMESYPVRISEAMDGGGRRRLGDGSGGRRRLGDGSGGRRRPATAADGDGSSAGEVECGGRDE